MRKKNNLKRFISSQTLINIFYFLFIFVIIGGLVNANDNYRILNKDGNFSIILNNISQTIYNTTTSVEYKFTLKNNVGTTYAINISPSKVPGWNITFNNDYFVLKPFESKIITMKCRVNKDFNYVTDVVSSDTIVISQKNNLKGSVDFPISISSNTESISLKFHLDVSEKKKKKVSFNIKFSTEGVSPIAPIKFFVEGKNLNKKIPVSIILEFANSKFVYNDYFDNLNKDHIYTQSINQDINPGKYLAKVTVRYKKDNSNMVLEWYKYFNVVVMPYKKIIITKNIHDGLFKDRIDYKITNLGNVESSYSDTFKSSYVKNFFLASNVNYTQKGNLIEFKLNLKKGETKRILFEYNYIFVYLFSFVAIILILFIYVQKSSNPLDVEVNLYDIKRVKYEGVKQVKIKIGFENLKEENIDNLTLTFRMPKYLNIKDNSFLLTKPNNVLKGKTQYKLIWKFKNFDKNESRILGFTLVNSRGILGDIRIPPLELEVKIKGKIRRYYKSVPTIRG